MTKQQYDEIIKEYKFDSMTYYAGLVDAQNCPYKQYDGYESPTKCKLTNKQCNHCQERKYKDTHTEPVAPKYHRLIHPIPTYCVDCQNKSTCKNIEQGIIWCPNKVC